MPQTFRKHSDLPRMEFDEVGRPQAPPDLRVARQSSCARAGRVDQDLIKWPGEGQRISGVENDSGASRDVAQPVRVDVACHRDDARFERLGCFVARRGAKVEECLTWPEIEERHYRLRAYVLNSEPLGRPGDQAIGTLGGRWFQDDAGGFGRISDVGFRLFEEGSANAIGDIRAELAVPAIQEPRRKR